MVVKVLNESGNAHINHTRDLGATTRKKKDKLLDLGQYGVCGEVWWGKVLASTVVNTASAGKCR